MKLGIFLVCTIIIVMGDETSSHVQIHIVMYVYMIMNQDETV